MPERQASPVPLATASLARLSKLDGVHPALAVKVTQIQLAMAQLGIGMIVTDGVRTDAEQHALWQKGRNPAGQVVDRSQVVTNADGIRTRSNHQRKPDGYGHAVDCCFLDGQGKPSWADSHPWALYGAMARALGLKWGGDWVTLPDRPHVELP